MFNKLIKGYNMFTRLCTKCGKTSELKKKPRSEVCASCAQGDKKDLTKTTCPDCGEKKSYQSVKCAKCSVKRGSENGMFGKTNKPSKEAIAKRAGDKHWNWKGGVTKQRSGKQIAWSKAVKANYSDKCDCCNYSREFALEAHHYKFSEGKYHDDFDAENGVSLCSNCHKEFHKTYGYGGNNKIQYDEFKLTFKKG